MNSYRPIQFGRQVRRFDKSRSESSKLVTLTEIFSEVKRKIVSKMFWGRGTYYKNVTHIFIIAITIAITISGIIYKVSYSTANSNTALALADSPTAQYDLLEQGGSIATVLASSPNAGGLKTYSYIVKEGDTLSKIADQYKVSPDTIRWASNDVLSPFTDRVEVGWKLTIPSINGVLYKVKPGQSLDDIISIASANNSEANKFNVIEFNNLQPPYSLDGIKELFVPDGNLKGGCEGCSYPTDIPRGVFIDPLSNPTCAGYTFSRGFLSYHNGVDLAKWNGCIVSAVANGTVEYAGWGNGGQGYYVRIDHGGGIETEYFHSNGDLYVKAGDRVKQGDPLMYMGCTGYCTGTHVHFILWKDKVAINPRPYVPYNGDY